MVRRPRSANTNIKRPERPANMASGVTSTVRNVSNTGQMSTSTHSTGATGATVNRAEIISNAGTPGAAGAQSASIQSISPSVTWDGGTNFQINPNLGTAPSIPATSEAVRGAFSQVEGELAGARQRALGMVPKEYHERVNTAFDQAHTQVSEHKKRLGY